MSTGVLALLEPWCHGWRSAAALAVAVYPSMSSSRGQRCATFASDGSAATASAAPGLGGGGVAGDGAAASQLWLSAACYIEG